MSDTGLMQPQAEQTTQPSEILNAVRNALAPRGGAQTLEDRLQALTQAQRDMLLSTAKMVKLAMKFKVAAGDYSIGYADLVAQMYGRMDSAKRQLIIELLDDISKDLFNYDLEFRIQELESRFSKDMSETTFNELKELKNERKIN